MWQHNKRSIDSDYYSFEPYRMVDVSNRCSGNCGCYAGVYIPSEYDIKLAKEVIERERQYALMCCVVVFPLYLIFQNRE